MAFSLIYTQRAPTRMWPQGVSKPAALSSRIFSSLLTSTRDAQGSGRGSFPLYRGVPIWGLGEKYFYGRFLDTAEHRTRVSRSFLRRRCLSDGIFSGSGADAKIQSSVRQAGDPRHRRPNAIRRQREILFCEPEFQQEPDRAYFL